MHRERRAEWGFIGAPAAHLCSRGPRQIKPAMSYPAGWSSEEKWNRALLHFKRKDQTNTGSLTLPPSSSSGFYAPSHKISRELSVGERTRLTSGAKWVRRSLSADKCRRLRINPTFNTGDRPAEAPHRFVRRGERRRWEDPASSEGAARPRLSPRLSRG